MDADGLLMLTRLGQKHGVLMPRLQGLRLLGPELFAIDRFRPDQVWTSRLHLAQPKVGASDGQTQRGLDQRPLGEAIAQPFGCTLDRLQQG